MVFIPPQIPFTKPFIKFPGTSLNPFTMEVPSFPNNDPTKLIAFPRPFIIPSAISFGRFLDSFKVSIHLRIAS